ncbi:hypothetical protein M3N64_07040 [Sporolactobacillus sp. CPB3-1]|uniref:Uncharacterized protein n=1 Tax=Sporolactobacillus mangiferae TaxID=2940498 RepID=A0ABT0MAL4_9BACL|nr:hypothetical protein [Sporolactobacillus mangiferae]MCL1631703.1 hypothetical protein [Sporolactobacillus mangiferae]
MESADQIFFLDLPKSIRRYRIIKRFIRQKLRLEKSNYRPSLHILQKMFEWNDRFQNQDRKQLYHHLDLFSEKTFILRTKRDVNRSIDLI